MSACYFVSVAPDGLGSVDAPGTLGVEFFASALAAAWPRATIHVTRDGGSRLVLALDDVNDDIRLSDESDCFSLRKADPGFFTTFVTWFRQTVPAALHVVAFDDQGSYISVMPGSDLNVVRAQLRDAGIVP